MVDRERFEREFADLVRERVSVPLAEVETELASRFGTTPAEAATHVDDALVGDAGLPFVVTRAEVAAHLPALLDGAVLTHRLSAAEQVEGHLTLAADLAPLVRLAVPRTAAGPLDLHQDVDDLVWCGPDGWLDALPLDALVAVHVRVDGQVTLTVVDPAPTAGPELLDAVRSAYWAEWDGAPPSGPDPEGTAAATAAEEGGYGLPVPVDVLVAAMVLADPAVFAVPRPPLSELIAAAGLERRRTEIAHDPSVWVAGDEADRADRLVTGLHPDDQAAALEAYGLLATPSDRSDPRELRHALDLLASPDVLEAVVDELLDETGEPPVPGGGASGETAPTADAARVAALVALAERLLAAAGRSPRAAVAGLVAAMAAERDGRVLDAESHLRAAAAAADGWEPVQDRLAWYESDRGDAAAALGRWLDLDALDESEDDPEAPPPSDVDPDVLAVRPFAETGPEPGRNDPCWCGSGRKYKQCHRGVRATAPLPERVPWLQRKAVTYLERRGGVAADLLDLHAEVVAGPEGDLDAAHTHPLVADVVLHEGGWLGRFLADRGPLLPADEHGLATSWTTVRRGLYEVLAPDAVRDVATGAEIAVPEVPAEVGELVVGRIGADGEQDRFLGPVAIAEPHLTHALLATLGTRDGPGLLDLLVHGPLPEPPPRMRTVLHERPEPRRAPAAGREVPAVVRALQERREQRWCDQPAPELDGATPREAAADPSRRAAVLALVDAVPGDDPVTGRLGLRPDRLRDLLGL